MKITGHARRIARSGLAIGLSASAFAVACGEDNPASATTLVESVVSEAAAAESGVVASGVSILEVATALFRSPVTLEIGADSLVLRSEGVPDHVTPYWGADHPLYEPQEDGRSLTPGTLGSQSFAMTIPLEPAEAAVQEATSLGPIGMALNGVAIYNDREGGNLPIDSEILATFDRAGGHNGPGALYHYHCDGDFTSYDDDTLIGFLRDGFPIYGRRDADGSYPSDLDADGGHVGTTADFAEPIYHYHASSVSYMGSRFSILKEGSYHGTKGTFSF